MYYKSETRMLIFSTQHLTLDLLSPGILSPKYWPKKLSACNDARPYPLPLGYASEGPTDKNVNPLQMLAKRVQYLQLCESLQWCKFLSPSPIRSQKAHRQILPLTLFKCWLEESSTYPLSKGPQTKATVNCSPSTNVGPES